MTKKNIPRIMIAAPKSGSGKTLITCALLKALLDDGDNVSAFKCGPDYIDPMFHKKVIEVASKNLDLFFTDEAVTKRLFLSDNNSHISVIEGVMGLYDGIGGVTSEASSYHLASVLKAPIIMVIDAHGMGRSLISLINGFKSSDTQGLIKGVILNNITEGFYNTIKEYVEKECGVICLGYFKRQKDIHIESRHLGLMLPDEILHIKDMVTLAANELKKSVDINEIRNIAYKARYLECNEEPEREFLNCDDLISSVNKPVRIGITMDEAFCFQYDDNIRMLEQYGAVIVPFSPLHDKKVPDNLNGIILTGGYPELYGKELEENITMRESVKELINNGVPSLAECGGYMYLHDSICDDKGNEYKMSGVINGKCTYKGRPVRFGYVTVTENEPCFLDGKGFDRIIKGHEFHYYDSDSNGESCTAVKPFTERSYKCSHTGKNHWWGFTHLYYPSNGYFVQNFISKCRNTVKKN